MEPLLIKKLTQLFDEVRTELKFHNLKMSKTTEATLDCNLIDEHSNEHNSKRVVKESLLVFNVINVKEQKQKISYSSQNFTWFSDDPEEIVEKILKDFKIWKKY